MAPVDFTEDLALSRRRLNRKIRELALVTPGAAEQIARKRGGS